MADNNDEFPPDTEAPEAAAGGRPAVKFTGSGGLGAAVWKRKNESGVEHYSVRIDRTYKDAEGQWATTPYLREGDLLRAAKLLEQIDNWVEQDRAKYRLGQASRDRASRE